MTFAPEAHNQVGQKRNSLSDGARNFELMAARCLVLIESTHLAIAHTQERVRRGVASMERERERGMGCDTIVLKPSAVPLRLVDCEVCDDPESVEQLNVVAGPCSACGERKKPLAAMVRFAAIDVELVLCGDCFQNLSDLSLGQVV